MWRALDVVMVADWFTRRSLVVLRVVFWLCLNDSRCWCMGDGHLGSKLSRRLEGFLVETRHPSTSRVYILDATRNHKIISVIIAIAMARARRGKHVACSM